MFDSFDEVWTSLVFNRMATQLNVAMGRYSGDEWTRKLEVLARGLRFRKTIPRTKKSEKVAVRDWTAAVANMLHQVRPKSDSLPRKWAAQVKSISHNLRLRRSIQCRS